MPPRSATNSWRNSRTLFLLLVILGVAALAKADSTVPPDAETLSSIVRGGRLYDNWHVEIDTRPPSGLHPAYPSSGKHLADPDSTWRCKECHGWDYKGSAGAYATGEHFTGIAGIDGMIGADPAKIVAVFKDDTHQYGGLMNEKDFRDLATFVSKGQIDMDRHIDRTTKAAKGDAVGSKVYFATICANCHGVDGQKFWTIPSLGRISVSNPWEAMHKILNGHPGENMPALRVFDLDILVGILSYIQSLPKEEILASVVRGGRLYDNWHAETGRSVPEGAHPVYPLKTTSKSQSESSWYCHECHGWDYKGSAGVYGIELKVRRMDSTPSLGNPTAATHRNRGSGKKRPRPLFLAGT